jgi:hypothetical protein
MSNSNKWHVEIFSSHLVVLLYCFLIACKGQVFDGEKVGIMKIGESTTSYYPDINAKRYEIAIAFPASLGVSPDFSGRMILEDKHGNRVESFFSSVGSQEANWLTDKKLNARVITPKRTEMNKILLGDQKVIIKFRLNTPHKEEFSLWIFTVK